MVNRNRKILLIEDDLALGNSILELLVMSNFNVEWLKNGVEAIEYLVNNTPDIIICDLMMPLMNGEEFFLNLRKQHKFHDIPFIIITANIDVDQKFRQLENGVNDYILKPFKVKELILKVNNLLDFKNSIESKFKPDPFSKVSIKLSEKDFMTSVNEILVKSIKINIAVGDLSNQLFVSKSTLDKKVRKFTGKNITQYMREFKLDYTIRLIKMGERNIQFLVEETGFNSFSYFSTSFKAYTGLAPRDYIKSILDKKPSLV